MSRLCETGFTSTAITTPATIHLLRSPSVRACANSKRKSVSCGRRRSFWEKPRPSSPASLAVSSSGYYEWRSRPESATAQRRERLKELIIDIFDDTYGHRRVHAELARQGVHCSVELARGLMRELGLVPCQPQPWRHSLTEADPSAGPIPDLLARDFTAEAPGVKMVGDITYIPTWEGWVYLATVLDCHTK